MTVIPTFRAMMEMVRAKQAEYSRATTREANTVIYPVSWGMIALTDMDGKPRLKTATSFMGLHVLFSAQLEEVKVGFVI